MSEPTNNDNKIVENSDTNLEPLDSSAKDDSVIDIDSDENLEFIEGSEDPNFIKDTGDGTGFVADWDAIEKNYQEANFGHHHSHHHHSSSRHHSSGKHHHSSHSSSKSTKHHGSKKKDSKRKDKKDKKKWSKKKKILIGIGLKQAIFRYDLHNLIIKEIVLIDYKGSIDTYTLENEKYNTKIEESIFDI